jgi:translation initiation factor 3 subunit H
VALRKQENAQREKRGEEPLPMRDSSMQFFKTYRDPSKLNTLLVRKQIDVYCGQIDDWAAQSFEKLHLVGAVQNVPSSSSS